MGAYDELLAWRNGTPTGGPYGDGRYPLTNAQGQVFYLLCPAADQAANEDLAVQPEIFAVEAGEARDAAVAAQTAAETAATSATGSASTATAKATAASDSAAAAATSASTATTKATAASNSATAAAGSASTATTKASEASASANAASTSAADAADSATEAYSWAMTAQTSVTGLLHYAGAFDASTGTFPTGMAKGAFYKITKAGTVSGVDLAVGDQIIFADPGWDKIDNTESVTSVAGRVGAVTLSIPDISGLQATLDGKATSAQGAKADTAVQPGQSLNLTAIDGQIVLSSPGQRQIGIVSTQTPRVGFYDITNSAWLLKIEADNSTTFAGSITVNTYLNSSTTNMVMSSSGAGAVYLRPAGPGSVAGQLFVSTGGISWDGKSLWHSGNFDPSTKANANNPTFTGTVSVPYLIAGDGNGTASIRVGNDANLWDVNIANTMGVKGVSDTSKGYIRFGSDTNSFGWDGSKLAYGGATVWHSGNFTPSNYVTTASIGTAASKSAGDFAASTTYGGGDLNTLLTSGIYRLNNNVTNGPPASLWGQLLALRGGGDTQAQMYFAYNTNAVFVRCGAGLSGSSWTSWAEMHTDANSKRVYVQSSDPGSVPDGSLWVW